MDADTADDLSLGSTRLIFQEEIVFEDREIRKDGGISLAQVDKDGNLKDTVWIQMNQLDLVVMKKAAKEFACWETKPALKDGGEHHYFVGVGSRNVFIFHRPPLEDRTGGGGRR
jgi:hypothetical protein